MAKLTRESRLRERRLDKQARKDARKRASIEQIDAPIDVLDASTGEPSPVSDEQRALDAAVAVRADA